MGGIRRYDSCISCIGSIGYWYSCSCCILERNKKLVKKFCDSALKPIQSVKENNNLKISQNPTVWVVLLDGAGKSKLKEYCFKNGEIRIGWGDCGEIITKETMGISNKERAILINFQDNMKIGDIVFVEKRICVTLKHPPCENKKQQNIWKLQ